MKVINISLALIFVIFAYIQLNDPDPLYWILVYGGPFVLLIRRTFGKHNQFWNGVCIGAVLTGMNNTAASFEQYLTSNSPLIILNNMNNDAYIENSREFIGLALTLIILAGCSIRKPIKSNKAKQKSPSTSQH